ncbi:MAG: carboxypeptidase-like regulatory domain-containing protein, partial [Sandaracinaceae bacterium]|nr:carboxypeptidase-like regulatory domain-containing protein [Sandaracinaceae bacterium]
MKVRSWFYKRYHLALLGCGLGMWGAGCTLLLRPIDEEPLNHCADHSECPDNSLCHGEGGFCIHPEAPSYPLLVEVTPLGDSILGPAQAVVVHLGEIDALGNGEIDLNLPKQVPVQGEVRFREQSIPAQLTFFARSDEPPLRTEPFPTALAQSVSVRTATHPSSTGGALTQLPGGRSYIVWIEPQGEYRNRLPPVSALLDVPENVGVVFRFDYDESQLVEIRGQLKDTRGRPVPRTWIHLVDSKDIPLSSRTTTNDDGEFVLWMHKNANPTRFRLRNETEEKNLQSFSIPVSAAWGMSKIALVAPSLDDAVLFSGRLELPLSSAGENMAAKGAKIRMWTESLMDSRTGIVGSFEVSTESNEEGRFQFRLPPGSYTLEA